MNKRTIKNGLLFDEYSTRAEYKLVTGAEAPPYNYDLPKKTWQDLNPRGDGAGNVAYNVLAYSKNAGSENIVMLDMDGKPVFTRIIMTVDRAKSVNLPEESFQLAPSETHPDRVSPTHPPINKALGSVPVPIRDLGAGERWGREPGMFGAPVILPIEVAAPVAGDGPSSDGTNRILGELEVIKQMLIRAFAK